VGPTTVTTSHGRLLLALEAALGTLSSVTLVRKPKRNRKKANKPTKRNANRGEKTGEKWQPQRTSRADAAAEHRSTGEVRTRTPAAPKAKNVKLNSCCTPTLRSARYPLSAGLQSGVLHGTARRPLSAGLHRCHYKRLRPVGTMPRALKPDSLAHSETVDRYKKCATAESNLSVFRKAVDGQDWTKPQVTVSNAAMDGWMDGQSSQCGAALLVFRAHRTRSADADKAHRQHRTVWSGSKCAVVRTVIAGRQGPARQ
jgi:hypothetical protein